MSGLSGGFLRNTLKYSHLRLISNSGRDLRSTIVSLLMPVVPGCGVPSAGQIGDNFPHEKDRGKHPRPEIPYRPQERVRVWLLALKRERGRRGRRTKAEIEAERKELQEKVEGEIAAIVAEMHALLPMEKAASIGAAYARYSTDFQHSISDQVRAIFEAAIKLGIFIPLAFICFDLAVPGCKKRRPGLDRLTAILKTKKAKTLLVLTTNRLYRKLYQCMIFVEEQVVGRGIRCIFIGSKIDSAIDERWRMPLQMHGMMDEMASGMYAANIQAAHIGLFLQGMVVSTLPFGYMGKDIAGPLTKKGLTRQMIVIDDELAEWVKKIFHWFVVDRMIQARILEQLNDQAVPPGPKSDGTFWTAQALHYLLTNPCYRGWWAYGKGKNDWQGEADYSKRVMRVQPLQEKQFEHLRLVPDEIWQKAQELLLASPQKNAGRKPVDGDRAKRPRDLNGLLVCKAHHCSLKVGGTYGQYMFCAKCRTLPKAKRPLYSYLNRALALKLICQAIADAIREDRRLIDDLMKPFVEAAAGLQQSDPKVLASWQAKAEKLTKRIYFIQSNPGESERDLEESKQQLKVLRGERSVADAEIAAIISANRRACRVPKVEEFTQLLDELEAVLIEAALGKEPADHGALRTLLEVVTGGEIVIEQMGERKACQGWLRARFHLHVVETCGARLALNGGGNVSSREIVVEIREPTVAERQIDEVKALHNQGMLVTAIGVKLGIDRHQVTAALRIWSERNGAPPPEDGRTRRARMADKLLKPPVFQRIADECKELLDEGLLIEEIATRVGRIPDTVRSALKYWHEQRGQLMPDMRNRRKTLAIKNRPRDQSEVE
jgi:DNA invertase Pin-like site-specific DNA recombinase